MWSTDDRNSRASRCAVDFPHFSRIGQRLPV